MFTGIERHHPFITFRAPAIFYAVLIFCMSSLPGHSLPKMPFFSFDKIVHMIEFGLFGIFMFRALRYPRPVKYPFLLAVIISVLYAASDEIHQLFVPGRFCSYGDFAADIIGIVLFTWISARQHPVKVTP